MDWDDERYAILYDNPEYPFTAHETADADMLLSSCQLAVRHPPEALTKLDRATVYDGALLERLALAIIAAPIPNPLRKAMLHGALRMHQAHLWSDDTDTEADL